MKRNEKKEVNGNMCKNIPKVWHVEFMKHTNILKKVIFSNLTGFKKKRKNMLSIMFSYEEISTLCPIKTLNFPSVEITRFLIINWENTKSLKLNSDNSIFILQTVFIFIIFRCKKSYIKADFFLKIFLWLTNNYKS